MDIVAVRSFFMWCTIINGGLLIFSFVMLTLAREWVYQMHSRFFPVPRDSFIVAIYCFYGLMKMFFLFMNLIPYIVLVIIS